MFDPIKELLLVIVKRKKMFFKIFSLMVAISLLAVIFRTPYYTSYSKIFINSKNATVNQGALIGGIFGLQSAGARDVQILSEIISGNLFFIDLLDNSSIVDSENQLTLKMMLELELNTDNVQKLHQHFLNILFLEYNNKKQIIDVGIRSNNREISKNITDLVLLQTERSYLKYKNNMESSKIESFNARILELENKLSDIENRLTSFRNNNISFVSSPILLIEYEGIVRDRLIVEQTIITLNSQKELSELALKSNEQLFLILNEPYLPPYKDSPSNKMLFLALIVLSCILSVTITVIIDEKSKKEDLI
jgi:uncharacterized protein involved in exopolysaccharide biosynthesis